MGTAFEELSKAVAGVVAAASPSVVGVGPAGSGFVLAEGLVVTNAHNLRGELAVTFADGRVAVANVAGVDAGGDLAVLSVPTEGAPALQWAQRPATVGDVVVGLSRPAGGGLRAGVGFVTGLDISFRGPGGRMVSGALEHSATLAHGSSGGPLVDGNGHLLGLNTHRAGEGLYLALPAVPELRRAPTPSPEARSRARSASVWRSPRQGSPAVCAAQSACLSATERSCTPWKLADRPTGPGSVVATSSPR